jgi:hypothetical protein
MFATSATLVIVEVIVEGLMIIFASADAQK